MLHTIPTASFLYFSFTSLPALCYCWCSCGSSQSCPAKHFRPLHPQQLSCSSATNMPWLHTSLEFGNQWRPVRIVNILIVGGHSFYVKNVQIVHAAFIIVYYSNHTAHTALTPDWMKHVHFDSFMNPHLTSFLITWSEQEIHEWIKMNFFHQI